MIRTRAAMLLLCAASITPSLAWAVTQEPAPDVHRQSLLVMPPDALALADRADSPPRLQFAPAPELAPMPDQPGDESGIQSLFTREALFADGTWIDKHVLQALDPQDTVVKIRKWWAKKPKPKAKPIITHRAR